jgi:peptidoglycan/LPS O-acetylase OafA/YrhL
MGLIRFLLACGVVLCHTSAIMGYSPLSGALAVQCFYIISGFYMAMILTEKYKGRGSKYLFYTNRALKIYPIYLLNLILLVIWGGIAYKLHYPGTLDYYTKYATPSLLTIIFLIIVNVVIIGLETLFLFAINKQGNLYLTKDFSKTNPNVYNFAFNSIAWTVGIELIFYIIAPWLTKRNIYILILILLLSLGLRIGLAHIFFDGPPWNYMFFPTQIMFFIAGIISYRIHLLLQTKNLSKQLQFICYGLFVSIIVFYYQFFNESYLKNAVLFISTMLLIPVTFNLTKTSRFDRFLGNLSYPIYISQALIIKFTSAQRFPKLIDKGFTSLLLIIVFSSVIDRLLTTYIEKIRSQRVQAFKQSSIQINH